jgi:hypothetical protein
MTIRTQLKAGGIGINHNEMLKRASVRPEISMRPQPRTASRKNDRLSLLVVRAGLRVGRRAKRFGGW